MFILKRFISSNLFVLFLFSTALAQENRAPIDKPREAVAPIPAAPLVTAAATAERVRFVSPGTVVQLRLEVYNETGQKLFDTELRGGNVLDWHLQDGGGARLAAGSYACVLTVKSLSGRLSQRVGLVTVNEKEAAVEAAGGAQLSTAQQQTIGPVEGNAAFTVLQESEAEAITAVTHDGTEGQLTSTTGALTFRTGDLFSGKDVERVRITEEGNVGIGTVKPEARLDVAGDIRARGTVRTDQVEFADGTVQTSGLSGRKLADGTMAPNATGTGTQNKVAKWTDNAGTLGDSSLTDTGGNVGLGVTSPGDLLDIAGAPNAAGRSGIHVRTTVSTGNATLYFDNNRGNFAAYGGVLTAGSTNPFIFFGVTRADKTFLIADGPSSLGLGIGTLVSQPVIFGTANAERMRIDSSGNVGVGTNNPGTKLDVAGDVNTSTQYNIGGSRVLSMPGTGNVFAGVGTGQDNTTGLLNSFFGQNAGAANTTGQQNSFFGQRAGIANRTGVNNSFFGQNAGAANTLGSANSFFGHAAGFTNTTGDNNSFFGENAGTGNTTGVNNSFFGQEAGIINTTGANNSFFGRRAGFANDTGVNNSFFGESAGFANTTGQANSFFGQLAGSGNTTGGNNSFFGHTAGQSNTTGGNNSFFGESAGQVNTTGFSNSFFGQEAGIINTTGANNSFFGREAGFSNTTGQANSFFGESAGFANTIGFSNSFFGQEAGIINTTGANNSFFGRRAGFANDTGVNNSFFGQRAGQANTFANNNSFFGDDAGFANTTGGNNSFFGHTAGLSNTTGDDNTFVGYRSDGAAGITNATAVGSRAKVTQSNSLVLGSINGQNLATADTNVGIGTTAPKAKLHVVGGSIYIAQPNSLVITSPNGNCWFITVSDTGVLSSLSVTCP